MIDLALILTTLFFSVYGLACAIESGIALALVRADSPKAGAAFRPLWEITNVFLVFGFTASAVLFNNALRTISRNLITVLSVALFGLLLRAGIVLYAAYVKAETLPRAITWLFAVTALAVPVSLAAAGAYFLSGEIFYKTLAGWLIVLTTLFGLLAAGSVYARWRYRSGSLAVAEILFSAWMLVLGSALPLAIIHTQLGLNEIPVAGLAGLAGIGLFLQLIKLVLSSRRSLWPYAAVLTIVTPLLLAWANRPYLITGKITLRSAYSAQAYAGTVVVGMIIVLPLIIFGFWLLNRRLATSSSAKH